MQAAVLNHDRDSVTSGAESEVDMLASGADQTRFTGNVKLSQTAATPHEGWMRKVARAVVSLGRKDAQRDSAYGAHQLCRGSVRRAHLPNGGRISCQTGSVWITADGGGEDIVLTSGACSLFRPGAWVVIEAIAKSEVIVEC